MAKAALQKKAATSVAIINADAFKKGIATAASVGPTAGGMVDIMKCAQDGAITMGMENEDVAPEEKWGVNPGQVTLGWICWKEGKPVDHQHRNFVQLGEHGPIEEADLEDHGPYTSEMDGWSEQSVMALTSMQDKLETTFPTSSLGGRQAIQVVINAIGAKFDADSPFVCPIVQVSSDSYFNKKFRKDIYYPVFTICGWMDMEGNEEAS